MMFNYVSVAVLSSPFGKGLLIRFAICSICTMSNCNFDNFPSFVARAGLWF